MSYRYNKNNELIEYLFIKPNEEEGRSIFEYDNEGNLRKETRYKRTSAFGTGEHGVRNYADIKGSATIKYTAFFHAMLDAGVYLPPSAFEAWFLSGTHDDTAMERIIEALPGAARAAAKV